MFGGLENPGVWLLIIVVILILFGAKRIPEMMHGLGKGLSEFKRGAREAQNEVQRAMTVEPTPAPPAEALKPVEASAPATPAAPAEPSSEEKPA